MKQQPILKSEIKTPWPKQKKQVAKEAIEWDLRTYELMKQEVAEIIKEIDGEAALKATDIRENIYSKSKEIHPKGGFNTKVTIGHPVIVSGDPTPSKAESLSEYRERLLAATEYKEEVRRINAIERTMARLDRSAIHDDVLRAKAIRMKYFDGAKSDVTIAQELNVSKRTLYRWYNKTIREIALYLGFIVC